MTVVVKLSAAKFAGFLEAVLHNWSQPIVSIVDGHSAPRVNLAR